MLKQRWLSPRNLIPFLGALLLVIGAACGTAATATPSPTNTPVPPTATRPPAPTATPTAASEAKATLLRAPEAKPKRGGVLRWGGESNSPHFDNHQSATVWTLYPQAPLFDNLLRYSPLDGGRKVIPDLAYKWDVSADGLTYTFHLREGVKFHDGALLTSEDVKATFDHIIFPQTGVISPRQSLFEAVAEVKAVDPLTVQFKLKAPRSFLPAAIATGWNVIERKKTLVDNNYDLKKLKPGTKEHPGTGPFILEEHQAGEFWKLERNPDYWNPELPYLDGIHFFNLAPGPVNAAAVTSGRVDYGFNVGPEGRNEIQTKYANSLTTVTYSSGDALGMFVNHERGPLGDARVRRAISMVMDRCAIVKATAVVKELVVGGWVPPPDTANGPAYWEATLNKKPGYNCPTSGADLAAAEQLLADAGFPNGHGFPKLDFMVRDINFMVQLGSLTQAMMRQSLNIQSDIRVVANSVWHEDRAKGNYDLGINGVAPPLALPAVYWGQFFTTGSGGNWNKGASNPEFDAIVVKLFEESDPQKSAELVRRGVATLEEWSPMIVTNHSVISEGWANYVKGHGRANRVSSADDVRFDTVWLDK